jgi:hypothetical protein
MRRSPASSLKPWTDPAHGPFKFLKSRGNFTGILLAAASPFGDDTAVESQFAKSGRVLLRLESASLRERRFNVTGQPLN